MIYWGDDLTVAIIKYPTGVKYYGQVGGTACLHPEIEGFILPLVFQDWSSLEELSCPDACCGNSISLELANKLKQAWPKQEGDLYKILLDESRLSEGTEAWFPIHIVKGKEPNWYSDSDKKIQEFLVGKSGFLLMRDNCD